MITTWDLRHITKPEMLRILKNVPGFTLVEQVPYEKREIDLSGFECEHPNQARMVRRELEEATTACEEFLSGIILTDSFKNHIERRIWRRSMADYFGGAFVDLYRSNKLRVNTLCWVDITFQTIGQGLRIYKVSSDRAAAIRQLVANMPSLRQYEDSLAINQKLGFVAEYDKVCRSFLDIVAKR